MRGRIHSFESMGLVDGPGIRCVVFMQGCDLRCRFCHNPDTWDRGPCAGISVDSTELVQKISRFIPYFGNDGGVTFSGGEPLLQPEFLLETMKKCRDAGISVCLDTAGAGLGSYDEILRYTDLILYDVKEIEPDDYLALTGQRPERTDAFIEAVRKTSVPMWVRHVVVPGLTDSDIHMQKLADRIRTLPNVEKVELLPYHILGVSKYETAGIPYSLNGVPAMDRDITAGFQHRYFDVFCKKQGSNS